MSTPHEQAANGATEEIAGALSVTMLSQQEIRGIILYNIKKHFPAPTLESEMAENMNECLLDVLKSVEWGGCANSSEVGALAACPHCYGWKPFDNDEFWKHREFRKGHKSDCALASAIACATRYDERRKAK